MKRITRFQTWSAFAALSAVTSLAIPAVSALADASDPASTTPVGAEQRSASAGPEARTSTAATPNFMFPERNYLQGIGWEVDNGAPSVWIEHLSDD